MLIELSSPVFKEKGKVRPPIRFKEGLNVILGKEDGENSIGKSSALLAIDFAFGGKTYASSDGVKHMGHHVVNFAFQFDGQAYHFARGTEQVDKVFLCNEQYQFIEEWELHQFTDWLKVKYHIDFTDLSFRTTLSSFFRIYGKDNTDERRPLRGIPGQNMQKSIDMLVKLFNRYIDIEPRKQGLDEATKKLEAFRAARKYRFVSDLVGGVTQYEENLAAIRDLEMQLYTLTTEQTESHSAEDIAKSQEKSRLMNSKLQIETEIQASERRKKLLEMSLEYGLYPTEADLSLLADFFPNVNLRKLYEVEKYHQKLATILGKQFAEEQATVAAQITVLNEQLTQVQKQIADLGYIGNLSKEFLDRHAEIKGRIDALRAQNEAYLTLTGLQDAKKIADNLLKEGIRIILSEIQDVLNAKMKEFNDSLFTERRQAPRLVFNEYNSYTFETPDDTGTGSNFKGMIVYDLAVLFVTALPAIAHDSLILKNIGDGPIDGIMQIYSRSSKQIFIAFDKQNAYKPATRQILENNHVLKLSDNGCELYGESWNKEKKQTDADEL